MAYLYAIMCTITAILYMLFTSFYLDQLDTAWKIFFVSIDVILICFSAVMFAQSLRGDTHES